MVDGDDSPQAYFERLVPSPFAWLLVPGAGLVVYIMFLPLHASLAIAMGALVGVLAGAWLWSTAATIELTGTRLRVGRAQIEVDSLGEVRPCSPEEMSHLHGPGSDARSYVLIRPWVRTGAYLEQVDPRDPTPYWLFSTRRPEELCSRIVAARSSGAR